MNSGTKFAGLRWPRDRLRIGMTIVDIQTNFMTLELKGDPGRLNEYGWRGIYLDSHKVRVSPMQFAITK